MKIRHIPGRNDWPFLFVAFLLLGTSIAAIAYRFYIINSLTLGLSFTASFLIIFILNHFGLFFNKIDLKGQREQMLSKNSLPLALTSLFGLALMIFELKTGQTDESIVSPWESVTPFVFATYYLTALACLLFARTHRIAIFILPAASWLVIAFVYHLGYGYDFFIHEASFKEIVSHGFILPKANFYFGQYTLLHWLNSVFPVPSTLIHLWLVPALSMVMLPWLVWRRLKDKPSHSAIAWLLLLVLPYAYLTFSTPQNLGLLLLVCEVILLSAPDRNNLIMGGLFVLFNLTIHPISAIPGLALILLQLGEYINLSGRKAFLIGTLLPLAIPMLLLVSKAAVWQPNLGQFFTIWPGILSLPSQEFFFLNAIYTYAFNLPLIVTMLFVGGWMLTRRHIDSHKANIGLALGILATVILMQNLRIKGVIDYEQLDYSKRLLIIAVILILPILLGSFEWLVARILERKPAEQLPWLIFFSLLLTASFYLSYPRHDNYFNSRGLSTSRADFDAVDYIDNVSGNEPYIVLANQQVSAAALAEFGFARYYRNMFYYPIPTTNPLYQYYLQMVYRQPDRGTAIAAMDSAGVDRAFLVLNKYWTNFPKLLEEAKLSATSYQKIGHGSVYVFDYRR